MKTIAIANFSSGCGRTQLTKSLSLWLQRREEARILIIDLSSLVGGNLSSHFMRPSQIHASPASIFRALLGTHTEPCTVRPGITLFVGNDDLLQVEGWFTHQADPETVLKRFLQDRDVFNEYDYILVDCNAIPDSLTRNAIVAADCILLPSGVRQSVAEIATKSVSITIEEAHKIRSAHSYLTEECCLLPVTMPLEDLLENDWRLLVNQIIAT